MGEVYMKTLTTKKTAMIIVAAAMSMQSLGLKAFADEICESYVTESTSVAQDKTQEQILSDAVFEAHQALMTKKALLDQALTELDAVKPDYESKELAYNESQNNASDKEETVSDELLDTMKSNLLEIQSTKKDLDKAWEEKDKAYEESGKAEAAYKNAQYELEKAKKAYGDAVAKAESADQGELEDAKKAVEDAEKSVETARADYESAVSKKAELEQVVLENTELLQTAKEELTAIEQKKASADEKMGQLRFTLKQLQDSIANDTTDEQVAEKKALIDKYQAEFDGLMETVNNYAMEIDKLQGDIASIESQQSQKEVELGAIEGKISEAKAEWDAKIEAKVKADEAYKIAEKAVEDNKAENTKLQAIVDEAKKNLDIAQAAHDKALEALGTLKADVINAQAKLDGMTDTYKEAVKKWNQGAYGYYSSLEYGEGVDKEAMYEFESEVLESTSNRFFVKLGEKTDPSGINNMIKAIDYLKACNELRRENGLEDLKIDMGLMSYAQLNSANNIRQLEKNLTYGHTSRFRCGENIAYGPGAWNPYDGWYGEEYTLFQEAVKSGKYPGLENMTSAQVYRKYPSLWHELGHYYNIMDPTYLYTGYGLGQLVTDDIRDGWYHHSQTFGKKGTGDIVMTVEEYEQSIKGYASGLQQIFDDYKAATEELANAQKALDEASKQTATYEALENAKKAYGTAQTNLSSSLEKASALEHEKAEKQSAYTTAVENEENAKVAYEAQVSAKTALETKIEGLKKQISQLNTQVSEKTSLKDAAFEKAGELTVQIADENHAIDVLKAKKAELLKAEENARINVENKQVVINQLNDSRNKIVQKVNDTSTTIETLKKELVEQSKIVDTKKNSLDSAQDNLMNATKTYNDLLSLNEDVTKAAAELEVAKTNYSTAASNYDKALDYHHDCCQKLNVIQIKFTGLNEDRIELEKLQDVLDHLKNNELDTEIPESKYAEITSYLNAYKQSLIDLESSKEAYNATLTIYTEKQESYDRAQLAYDEAAEKEKLASDAYNAYLQEQENKKNGFWIQSGNRWWYSHQDGSYTINDFEVIHGQTYYFDGNGYMVTGWQKIKDKDYYFNESGAMVTDAWVGNYYLQQDGSMSTNTWIGNYYVDSNGLWTPDQWIVSNGKYWYRHQDGSYTINDFEIINGQTYYFDGNGFMVTGWQKINNKDYYFNESGAMAKNAWVGNYYLQEDGSMATNTWIGNYYVDSNGLWTPDQWIVSNGKYWYRHQDGSYTINDFEVINGQTYYFDANGYMVTGWQKINDKDYYFNESGAMVTDAWIGNYYVDSNGVWDSTK